MNETLTHFFIDPAQVARLEGAENEQAVSDFVAALSELGIGQSEIDVDDFAILLLMI